MARIDNLLQGGEGSLGNLILYKMNGKNYVRTKPSQYRDKKSPAQLAQRQRLQVISKFLTLFREPLRVTFAAEAEGRSALQAAQSYNMRNALAGEYPGIYVDKNKVLLSTGPLPVPARASVKIHPEGLLIEWDNGKDGSKSASGNILVVMALSGKEDWCEYKFTGVSRSTGKYIWKLNFPIEENDLPDVWIAFQNARTKQMSDSVRAIK